MTKRTIEIEDDPAFQRKEWVAQRLGIGVFALLLVAAVLGFTGNGGPLSRGAVSDPSGILRVEYDRVVRRGAASALTLRLDSSKPGPHSFWISAEYLNSIAVETVVPTPEAVAAENGRYVYTVRTGGSDAVVILRARPARVGWLDVRVGVVGGPSVRFHQISLF